MTREQKAVYDAAMKYYYRYKVFFSDTPCESTNPGFLIIQACAAARKAARKKGK